MLVLLQVLSVYLGCHLLAIGFSFHILFSVLCCIMAPLPFLFLTVTCFSFPVFSRMVIVCSDACTNFLLTILNSPFNFVSRFLARTKIVQSTSALKSSGWISISRSLSQIQFSFIADFEVLDFLPVYLLNADPPSAFSVLFPNKTFEIPLVMFYDYIFFCCKSHSFFHFLSDLRWALTGHITFFSESLIAELFELCTFKQCTTSCSYSL